MAPSLQGKKIVIVGGASGIAREIAAEAVTAGAAVVLAGRFPEKLQATAAELGDAVSTARVDLSDEQSLRELAEQVGELDHVISLASDPANGPVADLERDAILGAFDAKVVGPILPAKHLAPRIAEGGSILIFSGVLAWRPSPGRAVMATANGAVSFLAEALAVELAPVRVNALSPGIVDSGAWDRLGDGKEKLFSDTAAKNPARRVGQNADVASAALLALANPFITGTTLHVDGGGRLA
jgi:NAD(P)-dependent dehydrogenase (short-subunit alcohol dehydrogenase family)